MTAKPPALPARWKLRNPKLMDETFSSSIWRVTRADGPQAVVKELRQFPDVRDELRGAHYLRWRRGEGAVRLFGVDRRKMLLEFAGERLLTDELNENGDRRATEIAAEVLDRLLSPSKHQPPAALQPLRERFASLFAIAKRDANSPYVEAAQLADTLLSLQIGPRPLHGDLHHDNIILGARGWLAIDPKGVFGDPAFDAANLFHNPLGRDDLCVDPERIAHMAELFGKTLLQPPTRILDFTIAYGCLSASWHAEDGNDEDEKRELQVVQAIRQVRDGM